MTIIRIKEFKGYTTTDFLEFLRIHTKSFYEIIIPKELDPEKDGDLFLQDYYNAIYIGQLLSRISHDIMWTTPDPYKKGEFSFIIITTKLKRLAKLLFYLTNAYDWEDNDEACIDLEIKATDISNLLKEGEEFACPSYVQFLNDYLEENEL
jgi:hypothetical protein